MKQFYSNPIRSLLFSVLMVVLGAGVLSAQCDRIVYVTTGGATTGNGDSRTAPVSFVRGIQLLNANSADIMRVQIGTYNYNTQDIPILTADNAVIEGGFDSNWNKSATNSDNSILNITGGTVANGIYAYRIGLRANGAQNFRVKDLRIDVSPFSVGYANGAFSTGRGNSIKGLHAYGNSQMDISRTTIRAGVGGYAGQGQDGAAGTATGIYRRPDDFQNPYSNSWNGESTTPAGETHGQFYVPPAQGAAAGGWGGGGVFGAYVNASTVNFYDSRTNVGDAGVGGEVPNGNNPTSNRAHGSPGDQRWTFHSGAGATRWQPNGSTLGPVTVNNCTRPTPPGDPCNAPATSFLNANGFSYPCYTMRQAGTGGCAAAIETINGGEVAQLPGGRNVTVYMTNPTLYAANFQVERICTNSEVQISKSGGSNNWTLPGVANYVNNVNPTTSSYNNASDNALVYYTGTGHHDLGVTGTSLPYFVTVDQTRTLPTIIGLANGDNICPNAVFKVSSSETGVEYDWKVATTAAPTTYVYDYVGANNEQEVSLPTTGDYIVRLKVRTDCCGWSRPVYVTVTSGGVPSNTTTWTGTVSDDWFDNRNWTYSVPSFECNSVIANVATQPIIETGRIGATRNIEINLGADLTFQNIAELDVFGDWVDNGSIVPNNGRVSFVGTAGNQSLSKGTGREVFYRMRVNNTDGLTLNSSAEATQQLQMDAGIITTGINFMYLSNTNAASLVATPANNLHIHGQFIREILPSTAPTWVYPMGDGTTLELAEYSNDGGLSNYDHVSMRFRTYGATPTITVPEPGTPGLNYICADMPGFWEVHPMDNSLAIQCGGYTADYTLTLYPSANNCPGGYQYWGVISQDNDCSGSGWEALPGGDKIIKLDPTTGVSRRMTSFSDKAVAGGEVILPFGLLSFGGIREEGISKLNWSTTTESEATGFSLARSENGVDFKDVNYIPATASASGTFEYDDIHSSNASTLYYRLDVEGKDGAIARSSVIELQLTTDDTNFELYPNPTTGRMMLKYAVPESGQYELQVVALDGRVVLRQDAELRKGQGQVEMDVQSVSPGAYLMKISQGNRIAHQAKFIRAKN